MEPYVLRVFADSIQEPNSYTQYDRPLDAVAVTRVSNYMGSDTALHRLFNACSGRLSVRAGSVIVEARFDSREAAENFDIKSLFRIGFADCLRMSLGDAAFWDRSAVVFDVWLEDYVVAEVPVRYDAELTVLKEAIMRGILNKNWLDRVYLWCARSDAEVFDVSTAPRHLQAQCERLVRTHQSFNPTPDGVFHYKGGKAFVLFCPAEEVAAVKASVTNNLACNLTGPNGPYELIEVSACVGAERILKEFINRIRKSFGPQVFSWIFHARGDHLDPRGAKDMIKELEEELNQRSIRYKFDPSTQGFYHVGEEPVFLVFCHQNYAEAARALTQRMIEEYHLEPFTAFELLSFPAQNVTLAQGMAVCTHLLHSLSCRFRWIPFAFFAHRDGDPYSLQMVQEQWKGVDRTLIEKDGRFTETATNSGVFTFDGAPTHIVFTTKRDASVVKEAVQRVLNQSRQMAEIVPPVMMSGDVTLLSTNAEGNLQTMGAHWRDARFIGIEFVDADVVQPFFDAWLGLAAHGQTSNVEMLYLCEVNGLEVDQLAQVASVSESAFPKLRVVLLSSGESKEGYTGRNYTKHVRDKLTGPGVQRYHGVTIESPEASARYNLLLEMAIASLRPFSIVDDVLQGKGEKWTDR